MNVTASGIAVRSAARRGKRMWQRKVLVGMRALLRLVGHRAGARRAEAGRLRADRRRLEELDASKSAFLRLAAHEMRTPLALARGYVEMVETDSLGPVPEPAKEALTL